LDDFREISASSGNACSAAKSTFPSSI
jgi:hypothetical protein